MHTINKESPHLAMRLHRWISEHLENIELKINVEQKLDLAFRLAMENGGREEVDFRRKEGTSYNPRTARIALVLINDAGIKNVSYLIAGMLATADVGCLKGEDIAREFSEEILSLSAQATKGPEAFEPNPNPALDIALALHLDRARHLHLTEHGRISIEELENFLDRTNKFILLAESANKPLHILLKHWAERYLDRIGR